MLFCQLGRAHSLREICGAKAISSNTGAGVADLLLGVASVSYNINPERVNSHPYYAGYVQDVQDESRATKK